MRKEWKELIRKSEREGWTVRIRANGHLLWVSPEGEKVYSSSSGDLASIHAHVRQMRKARARMTKEQFITMLIAKLNEREDVDRCVHIPSSNVFVTMKNGDTFPIVIGQKRRRG